MAATDIGIQSTIIKLTDILRMIGLVVTAANLEMVSLETHTTDLGIDDMATDFLMIDPTGKVIVGMIDLLHLAMVDVIIGMNTGLAIEVPRLWRRIKICTAEFDGLQATLIPDQRQDTVIGSLDIIGAVIALVRDPVLTQTEISPRGVMEISMEALTEAFRAAYQATEIVPVAGAVGFDQDFLGPRVPGLRKTDLLNRKNLSRTSTRFWVFQRPQQ